MPQHLHLIGSIRYSNEKSTALLVTAQLLQLSIIHSGVNPLQENPKAHKKVQHFWEVTNTTHLLYQKNQFSYVVS